LFANNGLYAIQNADIDNFTVLAKLDPGDPDQHEAISAILAEVENDDGSGNDPAPHRQTI
jgi:hypothetical protein